MDGQRLIYGIAVDDQIGYEIAAASKPELRGPALGNLLVRTGIGRLSEASFPGAVGYFGDYETASGKWAVFAKFYRSLEPERSRKHFVQRDVHLAPVDEFVRLGSDADFFVRHLSEPIVVHRSGESLPAWHFEGAPELTAERLSPLDPYDTALIAAAIDEVLRSRVVILDREEVSPDFVRALALLIPPPLRRAMTFATFATPDATADVRIRSMRLFPNDSAAVIDLDQKRVVMTQNQQATNISSTLAGLWKEDLGELARYHRYIQNSVPVTAVYEKQLDSAKVADRRWHSGTLLQSSLQTSEKWERAQQFLIDADDSTADRQFAIEAIAAQLKLPAETRQFIDFLTILRPFEAENDTVVKAVARRVAGANEEAISAAVECIASAVPRSVSALIETVVLNVPEERRWIETILRLIDRYALPEGSAAIVLQSWKFRNAPQWSDIRRLLGFGRTADAFHTLKGNKGLRSQIEADPSGVAALALLACRFDASDGALAEQVAANPQSVIRAIADRPADWWSWNGTELPLALITPLVPLTKNDNAPTIVDLFLNAYSRAVDSDLTQIDGNALTVAKKHAEQRVLSATERIRVADLRRPLAGHGALLRGTVQKLLSGWKAREISTQSLVSILGADEADRGMVHVFAGAIVNGSVNIVELANELASTGEAAVPLLLAMIGALVTATPPPRDFGAALTACAEGVATARTSVRAVDTGALKEWSPGNVDEIDVIRFAAAFLLGPRAGEEVRVLGIGHLKPTDYAIAIAKRLIAAEYILRELDRRELPRIVKMVDNGECTRASGELAKAADLLMDAIGSGIMTKGNLQKQLKALREAAGALFRGSNW